MTDRERERGDMRTWRYKSHFGMYKWEEISVTDAEDHSLLSDCQPHLSTFTSPPSTTDGKGASEGSEYANDVPHVDTMS